MMVNTSLSLSSHDVTVKILLMGGQEYTVILKSDSPILSSLFQAVGLVSQWEANPLSQVFEIPLNQGRASLCFPRKYLVGLVTDPPITINQVQPSLYLHIPNFLPVEENKALLEYVCNHPSSFAPSQISHVNPEHNYRKSLVSYSFYRPMITRVESIAPYVLDQLNVAQFPFWVESQLTASNDGDFFKIHKDNYSPELLTRELTYVYYFYREPKAFTGGELQLYDDQVESNFYVPANTYKIIQPLNNSIIFFLSHHWHEVLPVSCPSQAFGDSRFTINGWIRRR